ncbi:hypothetical protein [Stenotrophomonas oahuensis]|uniref:Uncharacterized protein n=1 Tax=Stenotrophomonas oahuensis TaxID=3003271 RepID=A0ABY9YQA3_9GAMM|nr:hypothetical protein [Stenotrophomonas sp. A5586]WNH52388.1 hypothetical protein PDM29_18980 [Stenotrophomonas sp. A5586]
MQLSDDGFNWLMWLLFEQGLWIVWISTPIWWPALRVLIQRGRLPRPLAYITVCAALGYGFVAAVLLVAVVPVKVIGIYLVPQLLEAGIAGGEQLQAADQEMSFLTAALLFSVPFAAIFGSRTLTRRWPALCGLGTSNDRTTG